MAYGFAGASMQGIAIAAGTSTTALYTPSVHDDLPISAALLTKRYGNVPCTIIRESWLGLQGLAGWNQLEQEKKCGF